MASLGVNSVRQVIVVCVTEWGERVVVQAQNGAASRGSAFPNAFHPSNGTSATYVEQSNRARVVVTYLQ